MTMFVKDLDTLKYTELQKLAKSAGIKANQKVDKLLKALKDHYLETEDDPENCHKDATASTEQASGSYSGASSKVPTSNPVSEKSERQGSATKNSTTAPLTPLSTTKADLQNTVTTSGENDNKKTRKRRRTFELSEPTLSAHNTPTLNDDPSEKRTTRQRSSENDPQSVVEDQPAKKRVRKNTYNKDGQSPAGSNDGSIEQAGIASNSSPGTRAMIEEIDTNLPSAERKEKLLAALDKKIKTKAPASPEQRNVTQPSQIPRFMAFLANKKAEAQKPATPGNKDWTKIHSKEFSKFDSLDIYLEKKQQRMEKLTGSAKMSTKVGAAQRKGSKIVKPVSRLHVETKPFVPTVTSTKNISFNFGKTPVTLGAKTPSKLKSNELSVTKSMCQTPRINEPVVSAKKSVVASTKNTPFIFTGNNNTHNTTVTSNKKTFDLKASLSKPLTWKPHCGKLQPVDFNKTQAPSTAAPHPAKRLERPSRQAMASKTRAASVKNVQRAQQLDRRNNQKYIDMMKRRGLLA